MGIIFNETTKTITLHTRHTSYQMKIGNLDYLLHLYYGPSIRDTDMSYQIMQYDRGFSGNPYESRNARTFSLDAQPQEFSTQQQGDFRTASIKQHIFQHPLFKTVSQLILMFAHNQIAPIKHEFGDGNLYGAHVATRTAMGAGVGEAGIAVEIVAGLENNAYRAHVRGVVT